MFELFFGSAIGRYLAFRRRCCLMGACDGFRVRQTQTFSLLHQAVLRIDMIAGEFSRAPIRPMTEQFSVFFASGSRLESESRGSFFQAACSVANHVGVHIRKYRRRCRTRAALLVFLRDALWLCVHCRFVSSTWVQP